VSYSDLRQQANRELAARLSELIEQHPDLRFGQILINFGFLKTYTTGPQFDSTTHVADPFSEEPMTTLSHVEEQIRRQQ